MRLVAVALLVPFTARMLVSQTSDPPPAPDPTTTLPLKPERTLRFTIDEGTWISLDVSPDGKTIVFDLLGDLYTLPIGCPTEPTTGCGRAKRITGGMGFDAQPRFAPDGKTIVFVSDRDGADNLWLSDVNGGHLRRLTQENEAQFISPDWTPDGRHLLVSHVKHHSSSRYELWIYDSRTGAGHRLSTPDVWTGFLGAAFGADPRSIYVAVGEAKGLVDGTIFPQRHIIVYDRDTGRARPFISRYGGAARPTVSPDGRYLVYATRYDTSTALRVRDLATGDERWLLQNVQRDEQEAGGHRDLMPGMSFTPDGRYLVHTSGGQIWRTEIATSRSTHIPFTASVELDLAPRVVFSDPINDSMVTVQRIEDARLSPDLQRVAFSALDRLWVLEYAECRRREVASRNGPDSGASGVCAPRRLTEGDVGEFAPVWSPDGRWIAYVTWSDAGGGAVNRVRSSCLIRRANAGCGNAPERLTRIPAVYHNVNYTPDGRRLVAVRGDWERSLKAKTTVQDLVWLPAAGGALTRIAFLSSRSTPMPPFPHFRARDNGRVYLCDAGEVVSMRLDGGERTPLAKVDGADCNSVQLNPRDNRAIATEGFDAYLFDIPAVGGAARPMSLNGARRLSDPAGQFPAWTSDGAHISYSLGRSLFVYDVARGESLGASYVPSRFDVRITLPTNRPSGTIALLGGRIITMRGHEVIPAGDLVVTNNRIVGIGATGEVAIPVGARTVDVRGKTLMPGLVDIHWHGQPRAGVHETTSAYYLLALAYGITSVRDPQELIGQLSYVDRLATGNMLGPRLFSSGPALTGSSAVTSLEQARAKLAWYREHLGNRTQKEYLAGNRRQRQWIVMAARERRVMPTSEGGYSLEKALTNAVDGYPGFEHQISVTPLYGDVLRVFAEAKITLTPTLIASNGWQAPGEDYWYRTTDIHSDAKLRRYMPHPDVDERALRGARWYRADQHMFVRHGQSLARIVASGGRVGLGGHGNMPGLGTHWELWMIQSGGMPAHDALRVATIFGAEAIGLGHDLGSLEPGKLADLLVLDRNPLEDIKHTTAIRYVMKGGRLYDGDTLTEVWPEQKPIDSPWWWTLDPEEPDDEKR